MSLTKFEKGYNNTRFKPLYDDYNWLYSSSANTFDLEKGLLGSEDSNNLNQILGSTMWNRNALAFNGDTDSANLRLGTFIDNDPTGTQFWINNEGKLELRNPEPAPEADPEDAPKDGQENPTDSAYLAELQAKLKALGASPSLAK